MHTNSKAPEVSTFPLTVTTECVQFYFYERNAEQPIHAAFTAVHPVIRPAVAMEGETRRMGQKATTLETYLVVTVPDGLAELRAALAAASAHRRERLVDRVHSSLEWRCSPCFHGLSSRICAGCQLPVSVDISYHTELLPRGARLRRLIRVEQHERFVRTPRISDRNPS